MAVDVRMRDVSNVVAQSADGYYVYPHAHASGGTLAAPRSSTTARRTSSASRPGRRCRRSTTTSRSARASAGCGWSRGRWRCSTQDGAPRLRAAPPYIVGRRRRADRRDAGGRGVRGRHGPGGALGPRPSAAGRATCTLRVRWPDEQVRLSGGARSALDDDRVDDHGAPGAHGDAAVDGEGAGGRRDAATATTALASAELYDRTTGTWAATGSMTGRADAAHRDAARTRVRTRRPAGRCWSRAGSTGRPARTRRSSTRRRRGPGRRRRT